MRQFGNSTLRDGTMEDCQISPPGQNGLSENIEALAATGRGFLFIEKNKGGNYGC